MDLCYKISKEQAETPVVRDFMDLCYKISKEQAETPVVRDLNF